MPRREAAASVHTHGARDATKRRAKRHTSPACLEIPRRDIHGCQSHQVRPEPRPIERLGNLTPKRLGRQDRVAPKMPLDLLARSGKDRFPSAAKYVGEAKTGRAVGINDVNNDHIDDRDPGAADRRIKRVTKEGGLGLGPIRQFVNPSIR